MSPAPERPTVWSSLEALATPGRPIGATTADPSLSPWAFTTLVAIARHLERQAWVAAIVTGHLGGDLQALARRGAFGHPDAVPQQGTVPGLAEWQYDFHGCGCCLTSRTTGESIDVDFVDDGACDVIDPFFFASYLESLQEPRGVEADLVRLHPSFTTVQVSLEELIELGLFTRNGRTRPTTATNERRGLLLALADRWQPGVELSRSMLERRRERLSRSSGTHPDVVKAYAETGPADLAVYLRGVLAAPALDGRTCAAMDLILAGDDPALGDAVWRLFQRIDPTGDIPQPRLWSLAAGFLLRHRNQSEGVLATLPIVSERALGEAALLALEHAPALGRPLLRKALRSSIPMTRILAAAALALVDEDWALGELEQVLAESTEEVATAECRAALRVRGDPNGAAALWDSQHRKEPPASGDVRTIGQLVLEETDSWLALKIEELRGRMARLAHRPN